MAPRLSWFLALILQVMGAAALAQGPSEEPPSFTRQRVFRIPFQTDPGERRLREIQLYFSLDSGRSWQAAATAPPDQGDFRFTAERDGLYWFAVRTVDIDGKAHPSTMEGARPALRVAVDTQPPIVDLRALPGRDGVVGVGWEARDDNLDLSSLRLEYRPLNAAEWLPLRVDPAPSGQSYWRPSSGGQLEVRLRVRDRADNTAEKSIVLAAVGEARTADGAAAPRPDGVPGPGDPGVRVVGSKRVSLNYEIKDKGPSGVKVVELWYTTDGRTWLKYATSQKNPEPPFVVDVQEEGLYGFTLVVKSGAGLGGSPPQVGDPPQVWVEVDVTKPMVRMGPVEVGRGPDTGRLTITWEAADKNLVAEPISLHYAQNPDGPWTEIAPKLANSRSYIWQMPADVPYSFYVKVEAVDRAGNIGVAQTPTAVNVDLHQPKGVIVDVSPAK